LVLVIGETRPELGLLADEVLDLAHVSVDSIRIPNALAHPTDPLFLGVTPEALVVLDGARLLADPRLFAR
jgi:chemotaxis signal transduction protein